MYSGVGPIIETYRTPDVKLSCVIPSIGRQVVKQAVLSVPVGPDSASFQDVVVVFDGCNTSSLPTCTPYNRVRRFSLGKPSGLYGSCALTVGALLSAGDFVATLADDDELTGNAAEAIRESISTDPEVDIWIPGLRYNDGHLVCMQDGLIYGNVAAPVFRRKVIETVPMGYWLQSEGEQPEACDFRHVKKCVEKGFKIGWIKKPIYLVRPRLSGFNGRGKLEENNG